MIENKTNFNQETAKEIALENYNFKIDSLNLVEASEKDLQNLLEDVVNILKPREGLLSFNDIKSSLSSEALDRFYKAQSMAVSYALSKLDDLLEKISPREPVQEIFKFVFEDSKKLVSHLEFLKQEGVLDENQIYQLEERVKHLTEKEVEFASLHAKI